LLSLALVSLLAAAVADDRRPANREATTENKAAKGNTMKATEGGPRKVIVGTTMHAMWGKYPGVDARLEELGKLIDQMAEKARKTYGRGVDICALPEVAVSGAGGPKCALAYKGKVEDYFAAKAREHNCYIAIPFYQKVSEGGREVTYNSCTLVDRKGKLVGHYHKVHAVSGENSDVLEGGIMPGKDFPVFECDFGRVGMQICWDMAYDDGWQAMGKKNAELVIWSTQSPGQIKAAFRAMRNNYYVLTSTWRNNASLFDPTGAMVKVIVKKETKTETFVDEIDLEYRLIPWQPALRNGAVLREKYGDKVGFRYSEAEDGGIFWSNDPATPIDTMIRATGLRVGMAGKAEKDRKLQDKLRGGPPSLD
jgi:predicted amidohydrolase